MCLIYFYLRIFFSVIQINLGWKSRFQILILFYNCWVVLTSLEAGNPNDVFQHVINSHYASRNTLTKRNITKTPCSFLYQANNLTYVLLTKYMWYFTNTFGKKIQIRNYDLYFLMVLGCNPHMDLILTHIDERRSI
jgi:hypothetical protein